MSKIKSQCPSCSWVQSGDSHRGRSPAKESAWVGRDRRGGTIRNFQVLKSGACLVLNLVFVAAGCGSGGERGSAPESAPSPLVEVAVTRAPAQPPKFLIQAPAKGSKSRIGDPIRVQGTVTLPKPYFVFYPNVVIENYLQRGGKSILVHSQTTPLREVGPGVHAFDKELREAIELPSEPGKYQIRVVGTGLQYEGEQPAPRGQGQPRAVVPASEMVPYEVIP